MANTSVDDYIAEAVWGEELQRLRKLLLAAGLQECVKWGGPCYTLNDKNVVGLGSFKSYFGLWFFQGALLRDPDRMLMNAQPGKTRAMRQWRMHSAAEIDSTQITRYLKEAIENAREGQEIAVERGKLVAIPPELARALSADRNAARSFQALRTGLRREYADYIASAKRSDTKQRRLDKILPMIAAGAGLNDKYR